MKPTTLISFAAALLTLALVGCTDDSPSDDDGVATCSVDDLFVAEHCGETYCGLPTVEVGSGATEFEPLEDGDEVDIWFGSQGGYHIDFAAEMTALCPIVYLHATLWLDPGDGSDLVEVVDDERHVEAIRTDGGESSVQQSWGLREFLPCRYWPDDPDHNLQCAGGAGSAGHIEDFEIVLRIEAEDHNGRTATDERRVRADCCRG